MIFGTETAKSLLSVFIGFLPGTWEPASGVCRVGDQRINEAQPSFTRPAILEGKLSYEELEI